MACSHMMNDSDNNILLLLSALQLGMGNSSSRFFSFFAAVAANFWPRCVAKNDGYPSKRVFESKYDLSRCS